MYANSNIKFKNYYKILGIDKNASEYAVKKAFRKLAIQYHPDITKNNKFLEYKFKDICEAYEVLSDKEKKQKYDQLNINDWNKRGITANLYEENIPKKDANFFSDFFHTLFDSVKDSTVNRIKKTNDVHKLVIITLEEAFAGTTKDVFIEKEEKCKKCKGEGKIDDEVCIICKGKGIFTELEPITAKIPKGVNEGTKLYIKNKGLGNGNTKGDLILTVKIQNHKIFEIINEHDILCELPITPIEAVLGFDVEIPTLNGSVKMKIPAGTQSEQTFRIKDKGLLKKNDNFYGDLFVKIKIVVPKFISDKEKELYKELALVETLNPREKFYKI